MEKLLGNIAKKITDALDKNNQYSELERLQMFFGIQNVIYNVTITALILILSCITNNFIETLLFLAFFGILRIIAGGYHFDSMEKCIAVTTLIMVGGGKCVQLIHISLPVCVLACILLNVIFFSYIPKGTHNNPYSKEYGKKQKKRLEVLSVILSVTAILSNSLLRSAIIFSMLIDAVLLFPTWNQKFPTSE